MRVIDSHVHLYPAEVNCDPAGWAAGRREGKWAQLCTRRRKNGTSVQTFPGVDGLLAEMDRAGVERAVLLGWYWENAENCAMQNRFYAEGVRAHPDRLAAFAAIQPRAGREETVAELRRARDDGLIGLGELSPHAQGYGIADAVFGEVLAVAAEWRWPVNLHVTDPDSRDYAGRVATPLADFARLARDFPRVNFVLAHWGGLLPLREPESARLGNLFYDSAASPLIYDESVWQRMLAAAPADRVLFGSDYPLNLFPQKEAVPTMARLIAQAEAAGLPGRCFAANAVSLLRL